MAVTKTETSDVLLSSPASEVYEDRRAQLAEYFDQTAVEHWRQLTSETKVSRVRESVRAGRATMQQHLLSWLPADLTGARVLDAGCGTGTLSAAVARRGATVVGVDLSPQLIEVAERQRPREVAPERLSFSSGDMLAEALGEFDYIVAMDSLIHYRLDDTLDGLGARLSGFVRVRRDVLVRRDAVVGMTRERGRWRLELVDGNVVEVSRRRTARVLSLLRQRTRADQGPPGEHCGA